jgi:hypothetical protein
MNSASPPELRQIFLSGFAPKRLMWDFCEQQADAPGNFRRAVRFRKEKLSYLSGTGSVGVARSEHHVDARSLGPP